ncbi:hypothetical protein [Pseudomonas mosselii]|uniref:Uncharacterized protein n=1 Tax=Pseudomonas mosselii TaxID=78327 RepID=A0ABX9AU63_9PSED|nr:hypothetical protein [Pseudomonas mosselii]QZP24175.1 hypothetical protein K5H97_15130 [Pseudomonas mosselii]
MKRRGNVVHTVGDYKVYEMVTTYMNNQTKVESYSVVGPRSDPTWLHSLESAVSEAEKLAAQQ